MNSEKQPYNTSIDSLRVLLAFLVICLHFPPVFFEPILITALGRVAVPTFFLISGYFLYNEDNEKIKIRIKNQTARMLKISIIALLD